MGDAKTYEKLVAMAINEENDPIVVSCVGASVRLRRGALKSDATVAGWQRCERAAASHHGE